MIGRQDLLVNAPAEPSSVTIVLAHGAGAPMDSPFMNQVAAGLALGGLRVARFEFPYMRERRDSGKRRPPDPAPVLCRHWLEVVEQLGERTSLVIGGKSLGGRIASMIADEAGVLGLVCLGYPFHPPGRPERPRVDHLRRLGTPALFIQGTRDPFGSREEIERYELSLSIRIEYVEGGDHSLAPAARAGGSLAANLQRAVDSILGSGLTFQHSSGRHR